MDSEGPEKYKRGLYVFTQRTVPYPISATFDGPNPNEACPRREKSNTPLQALTLLNNPTFVECAQGFARRVSFGSTASSVSPALFMKRPLTPILSPDGGAGELLRLRSRGPEGDAGWQLDRQLFPAIASIAGEHHLARVEAVRALCVREVDRRADLLDVELRGTEVHLERYAGLTQVLLTPEDVRQIDAAHRQLGAFRPELRFRKGQGGADQFFGFLQLATTLEQIAQRIKKTRDETFVERLDDGREVNHTLGIASLGGATLDNEENYLIKKLFGGGLGIVSIENQARI